MKDINSLSHSRWRCKYHIVFAPKYRRQVIYGKIKADVGKIRRELCERKGVEIEVAECCKRSYSHAGEYPTPPECITVHGVFEKQKQSNDI